MNLDPVAFEPDPTPDENAGPGMPAQANLSDAHAQKIAELFREEYPKLVHYMVARTGSWPEARDVAACLTQEEARAAWERLADECDAKAQTALDDRR